MWYQLFAQQFHFALHMFGVLVFLSAGWLYLDALNKNCRYLIPRAAGFFILSVASLLHAIQVDFAGNPVGNPVSFLSWATAILPAIGYLSIFFSFPYDPIQKKPVYAAPAVLFVNPVSVVVSWLRPFGVLGVALMYYIHVAEGLEWHLLMPSLSFFAVVLSEVAHAISVSFAATSNIFILQLVSPFGLCWWVEHSILLVGLVLLFRWVFWYLLKSFEMQLALITSTGVVVLTVVITAVFANHLFDSLVREITTQMTNNAKVFSSNIESRKREALADARFLAMDTHLITAISETDNGSAESVVTAFMMNRTMKGVAVTNPKGVQIVSHDEDRVFTDASTINTILSSAEEGFESVTITSTQGIIAPTMYLVAAVPVKKETHVIGIVLVASSLDDAVIRGLNQETGFDVSIFAGDQLSVTSLTHAESVVGLKETNPDVKKSVLVEGIPYEGLTTLDGVRYMGTYLPMKNISDFPVGMIFVGRPFTEVFEITARAIEGTYMIAGVLLLLSVVPSLLIGKYIVRQIH